VENNQEKEKNLLDGKKSGRRKTCYGQKGGAREKGELSKKGKIGGERQKHHQGRCLSSVKGGKGCPPSARKKPKKTARKESGTEGEESPGKSQKGKKEEGKSLKYLGLI